jgi:hypothetical protein
VAGGRTRRRRLAGAAVAALAASAPWAAPAGAVPACPDAPQPRVLADRQGSLEAVAVGGAGRIYYSATDFKAVMRIDAPGEAPQAVAGAIEAPGGIVVEDDGSLVVTEGDSLLNGVLGNLVGLARLWRLEPATGRRTLIAEGLGMGNGLARGPDGTFYASNDLGLALDRIRGSRVERWATVLSANGLAVGPSGHWLYAAQAFAPAAIVRIRLDDPRDVATWARPGLPDIAAGLDGMTIDAAGRLYVAANLAGEVWRVDRDRSICALARGLGQPSAVALRGDDAIVVGFGGQVVELPGAVP